MPLPSQKNNTSLVRNWTVLHAFESKFLNGKSILVSEEIHFDTPLFSHPLTPVERRIDSIQSVYN